MSNGNQDHQDRGESMIWLTLALVGVYLATQLKRPEPVAPPQPPPVVEPAPEKPRRRLFPKIFPPRNPDAPEQFRPESLICPEWRRQSRAEMEDAPPWRPGGLA